MDTRIDLSATVSAGYKQSARSVIHGKNLAPAIQKLPSGRIPLISLLGPSIHRRQPRPRQHVKDVPKGDQAYEVMHRSCPLD